MSPVGVISNTVPRFAAPPVDAVPRSVPPVAPSPSDPEPSVLGSKVWINVTVLSDAILNAMLSLSFTPNASPQNDPSEAWTSPSGCWPTVSPAKEYSMVRSPDGVRRKISPLPAVPPLKIVP
jgi:hypothetical protein